MRVVGYGPTDSGWFVCGEGPGPKEDKAGVPFVGKTGEEMTRLFDGNDLPALADIFRTNIYRQYEGKDYEYTKEDFERDEPELLEELKGCQPSIIVTVGRHATRYFLGDVSMDEVHGLPWFLPTESSARRVLRRGPSILSKELRVHGAQPGRPTLETDTVVFPAYHPAAGFRSPETSALVSYDFGQLVLFTRGELTPRMLYDDPIPEPVYIEIVTPAFIDSFDA